MDNQSSNQNQTEIVEIKLIKQPDKIAYYPGESLDLRGLQIEAKAADGKTYDITKDCSASPKTHLFTEGDSYLPVTLLFSSNGKNFSTRILTIKINEYHENKVITKEYDKKLSAECINGTFVGKQDGDIIMFKGIPFVREQPIGKNRFKAPVSCDYSASRDKTVKEAYYFGKKALQEHSVSLFPMYYPEGEDCLYLNIYINSQNTSSKKPVMVWIHGGSFVTGGCADPTYNLYNICQKNPDVIFISIQYRLSCLGFLDLSGLEKYSDEYKDSANLGILDQAEALHWIYENIGAFGGDAQNITLFGQSAGGVSAALQLLIKKSRQYISKVILQSGSPFVSRTKEYAQDVARNLFSSFNIKSIDDLLQTDPQKLIDANQTIGNLCTFPERDGNLLPLNPIEKFESGIAKDIPILQGINKNESNYWIFKSGGIEGCKKYLREIADRWTSTLTPDEKQNIREFMEKAGCDELAQLLQYVSQTMFVGPCFCLAEAHSKGGGDVYQYYFTAESAVPALKSCHVCEISAVFSNYSPLNGRSFSPVFEETIQKMWIQFAKTGNPSLSAEKSPTGKKIEWPKYSSDSKVIMQIDENQFHVEYSLADKLADWDRTYPLIKSFGNKPLYL